MAPGWLRRAIQDGINFNYCQARPLNYFAVFCTGPVSVAIMFGSPSGTRAVEPAGAQKKDYEVGVQGRVLDIGPTNEPSLLP